MGIASNSSAAPMDMNDLQQASWSTLTSKDWYAKSLLDLGEYLHAAHVLCEATEEVDVFSTIPGPATDLSTFGVYLRAYALYMAGERRKEEDHLEMEEPSR